jgi:hypothetical protein
VFEQKGLHDLLLFSRSDGAEIFFSAISAALREIMIFRGNYLKIRTPQTDDF